MKLFRLLENIDVLWTNAPLDVEISGISTDSRTTRAKELFVCVRGSRYDSHESIREALEKGAVCVICDRPDMVRVDYNCVLVKDTRIVLAKLFSRWYGDPGKSMKIAAVTGTNAKTTVSSILYEIYRRAGRKTGLIGTVECKIDGEVFSLPNSEPATTPSPATLYKMLGVMRDSGIEYVSMEASSHALRQHRLDGLTADIGVFTNLSREHLDYHGSMQEYLLSKASLFRMSRKCLANMDNPYFEALTRAVPEKEFISFSANAEHYRESDYIAKDVIYKDTQGISYVLCSEKSIFRITSPMIGKFGVYNTLAAAAAAVETGVDPISIQDAVSSFAGPKGRCEKIVSSENYGFSVFIDYAHTPDALSGLLSTFASIKGQGRLVVLFGCGGDRDKGKRPIMGRVASEIADFTVVTTDNPRSEHPQNIIDDIVSGMKPCEHKIILDRKEAIEYAITTAKAKDVILLCGKGHEDYEINEDKKHPFSERDIVNAALRRRL